MPMKESISSEQNSNILTNAKNDVLRYKSLGVDLNKLQHMTFLNNNEVLHLQKQGIINIRKNKLMINENYFNVHDYIVKKIIDNYLSS